MNNLPEGNYILKVSHVGFLSFTKSISINKDDTVLIELSKMNTILANVFVSSEKQFITHTLIKSYIT